MALAGAIALLSPNTTPDSWAGTIAINDDLGFSVGTIAPLSLLGLTRLLLSGSTVVHHEDDDATETFTTCSLLLTDGYGCDGLAAPSG